MNEFRDLEKKILKIKRGIGKDMVPIVTLVMLPGKKIEILNIECKQVPEEMILEKKQIEKVKIPKPNYIG